MPREVLLHVGMHKTGTTALQYALDGYDDSRLRYARLGDINHSIAMVTAFAGAPQSYHVWQQLGASADQVARKAAAFRQSLLSELALPHRKLVIIGEEISMLYPAAIAEMLATLRGSGRRPQILAYLRDPLGYVTSAFQQQVRGGQTSFALPRPLYAKRFEKFVTQLGRDAVTFRDYAPLARHSVVADFAELIGIPTGAMPDRRANPALPMEAVRLLHLFNRSAPQHASPQGPAARAARSALIRHLATRFSGHFTLPAEVAATAIDLADLDWIERAAGFSLGPRPDAGAHIGQADPDHAPQAMVEHMSAISDSTIDRLRSDLTQRRLQHDGGDTVTSLLAKLYQSFLPDVAAPIQSLAN